MSVESRKYGTPYIESEALLAIVNDDVDHARAVLETMSPGERHSLEHHCEEVINIIQDMREGEE
ncbi:hypothetical protein ACWEN6_13855 [Sphaerisporangium sp. NPDC004334]